MSIRADTYRSANMAHTITEQCPFSKGLTILIKIVKLILEIHNREEIAMFRKILELLNRPLIFAVAAPSYSYWHIRLPFKTFSNLILYKRE